MFCKLSSKNVCPRVDKDRYGDRARDPDRVRDRDTDRGRDRPE